MALYPPRQDVTITKSHRFSSRVTIANLAQQATVTTVILSVAALLASCAPPQAAAPPPPPISAAATTPNPAVGATEAALKEYPDLAVKDSVFNRTFRDLYTERAKTDPIALTRASWPLDLARETGAMLGVSPIMAAPTPDPSASPVVAGKTWFQQRQDESAGVLDNPGSADGSGANGASNPAPTPRPQMHQYHGDSMVR